MERRQKDAENPSKDRKLPSYRDLRARKRERLRNAGEQAKKSLSDKGKADKSPSTKELSAGAGSTGLSTPSGGAAKPATSDDLLSSDDYEVKVVNSLVSTSSDEDKNGTAAALALQAAQKVEKEATGAKIEEKDVQNQPPYRIPRKPEGGTRIPEPSHPLRLRNSSSLPLSGKENMVKEDTPAGNANLNTPEAMA